MSYWLQSDWSDFLTPNGSFQSHLQFPKKSLSVVRSVLKCFMFSWTCKYSFRLKVCTFFGKPWFSCIFACSLQLPFTIISRFRVLSEELIMHVSISLQKYLKITHCTASSQSIAITPGVFFNLISGSYPDKLPSFWVLSNKLLSYLLPMKLK